MTENTTPAAEFADLEAEATRWDARAAERAATIRPAVNAAMDSVTVARPRVWPVALVVPLVLAILLLAVMLSSCGAAPVLSAPDAALPAAVSPSATLHAVETPTEAVEPSNTPQEPTTTPLKAVEPTTTPQAPRTVTAPVRRVVAVPEDGPVTTPTTRASTPRSSSPSTTPKVTPRSSSPSTTPKVTPLPACLTTVWFGGPRPTTPPCSGQYVVIDCTTGHHDPRWCPLKETPSPSTEPQG